MIEQQILREAAKRTDLIRKAKSLMEAKAAGKQTAFLCHSHADQELVIGLQILLIESGWDVYVDWQDSAMPEIPNAQTAKRIQEKIISMDWFLFLATKSSTNSKWCPWEIGFADAKKSNSEIIIIPTREDNGSWHGNEYLQLYRKLSDARNQFTKKIGYAVFDAGAESGIWLENLSRKVV